METLDGLLCLRERDWIYKLHRNAQRLLKPLLVANPYAEQLTFLDDTTRSRRDHKKYLTLIRTIALLHQFQRPQKTTVVRGQAESYIEVSFDDIELANRLADEVLGRSLDELPPQTRRLLLLLEKMVLEGCERLGVAREYFRFSQREVREYTGFGNTQVKTHLRRLEELEYIRAHRGMRGQMFSYELAYDGKGKDGSAFFHGLLDVEALRKTYGFDAKWAGQKFDQSALSRGEVMHLSGPGRVSKSLENEDQEIVSEILEKKGPKCTSRDPSRNSSSYAQTHHSDVSLSAAAKESEEC